MTALRHLREGVDRVWHTIEQGWHELSRRAGNALTLFTPASTSKAGEQPGGDWPLGQGSRWGLLVADVSDDDDRIVVRLEAPGMDTDDFDIRVDDDRLSVRGEKRVARKDVRGGYRVSECAYGRFRRDIPLPAAVTGERAKATYRRGVLKIVLRKTRAAGPRRIPIRAA